MPLHFGSITKDSQNPNLLASLLQEVNNYDTMAASADKKYLHLAKDIFDRKSRDKLGQFVFTLHVNEERKALEALDLDIVLSGGQMVDLRFLKLRPDSSDANEYYDAEIADDLGHLQIETVNRHIIDGTILDSVRAVRVSAFPFSLTVYDDMDAFNVWAGFKTEVTVKGTDYKVGGYSNRFIAPGNALSPNVKDDETYSFVVGTVKSYRDVEINVGMTSLPFVIAQLDTALGVLPTAMSREVFALDKLTAGKVIVMKADIKADFAV